MTMSQNNKQRYCSDLNVLAILRMQEGKFEDAIAILRKGLQEIKERELTASEEDKMSFIPDNLCSKGCSFAVMETAVVKDEEGKDDKETNLQEPQGQEPQALFSVSLHNKDTLHQVDQAAFVLFDRALHVSSTTNLELLESCPDLQVGVLLYNMALSNHLLGLRRNKSKILHKALDIYRLAGSIFQEVEESCVNVTLLLNLGVLATTTNKGHLLEYFHRQEDLSLYQDEIGYRLSIAFHNDLISDTPNGESRLLLQSLLFWKLWRCLTVAPAA